MRATKYQIAASLKFSVSTLNKDCFVVQFQTEINYFRKQKVIDNIRR